MAGFSITPPPTPGTPTSQQLVRQDKITTPKLDFSKVAEPRGPLSGSVAISNQQLQSLRVPQVGSSPFANPSSNALLRQEKLFPGQRTDRFGGNVPESISPLVGDPSTELILSARGTAYLIKLSADYGPGLYAVDNLTREILAPDGSSTFLPNRIEWQNVGGLTGSRSVILITGIEFNQVDITSQVPCLNNFKVFYAFGQNFGQISIVGEVLLGPLGDVNTDGVNRLIDFFWKYRVSESRIPIGVSVAHNGYLMYLTGLRIGKIDPEFHVMPFLFFGTLLDINREKTAKINLAGTVLNDGSLDEPSLFTALTTPSKKTSAIASSLEPFVGPLPLPAGSTTGTTSKVSLGSDPSMTDYSSLKTIKEVPDVPTLKAIKDVGSSVSPPATNDPSLKAIKDTQPAGPNGNATAALLSKSLRVTKESTLEEQEFTLLHDERDRRQRLRTSGLASQSGLTTLRTKDDDNLDAALDYGAQRVLLQENVKLATSDPDAAATAVFDFDKKSGDEFKVFRDQVNAAAPHNAYFGPQVAPGQYTQKAIDQRKADKEQRERDAVILNQALDQRIIN